MMLVDKIKALYPDLSDEDFASGAVRLQDDGDGKGPYIAEWDVPGKAKPDEKKLPDPGPVQGKVDPVQLLAQFLAANPDVLALVTSAQSEGKTK